MGVDSDDNVGSGAIRCYTLLSKYINATYECRIVSAYCSLNNYLVLAPRKVAWYLTASPKSDLTDLQLLR